jgi:hypothetical protein
VCLYAIGMISVLGVETSARVNRPFTLIEVADSVSWSRWGSRGQTSDEALVRTGRFGHGLRARRRDCRPCGKHLVG